MWANLHVVCHMYKVVEQRALTDDRVTETAPVNTGIGPDICAIADAHPAELRHPLVTLFGIGPHESEPGLPDSSSRVHMDVCPDHRANDRRVGVNARSRPKNHAGSDRCIVTNPRSLTEFCARADYGSSLDSAARRNYGIDSDSRISADGGTGKSGRIERIRHPSKREAWIVRRQAHRLSGNFRGQNRGRNAGSSGSRKVAKLRSRNAVGQRIPISVGRRSYRSNKLTAVCIPIERGATPLG